MLNIGFNGQSYFGKTFGEPLTKSNHKNSQGYSNANISQGYVIRETVGPSLSGRSALQSDYWGRQN